MIDSINIYGGDGGVHVAQHRYVQLQTPEGVLEYKHKDLTTTTTTIENKCP